MTDGILSWLWLLFCIWLGVVAYHHWATIVAVFSIVFPMLVLLGIVTIIGNIASGASAGAKSVASWADHTFVKHPAEPIIKPVLREGKELDARALRSALMPTPSDLNLTRPTYHYENQANKARAMTDKLNENARLAEAAVRLERKRAELRDAQADFEDAKRKSRHG